jgi:hypothetical protein
LKEEKKSPFLAKRKIAPPKQTKPKKDKKKKKIALKIEW